MSNELATIAETTISITPPSAVECMQRAEIDVQISTAHRFPRSMKTFKTRAVEMATLDEETAASCIYSRPVGGGKFAEGLSVRTAEIVGACYGNLRVAATIVEQTERYVVARGMAHDLESNFASACEVIEATVKKDGSPYDERMRVVIAKAALAKARRDATFQVVPKALCKPIEMAARAVAVGDASTIDKRREAVMGWIGKLGVEPARVFAALGVKGVEDLGLDHLTQLTGLKTAIKDGEVSVDEAFPPLPPQRAIFASKKADKPAETPPPSDPQEQPLDPLARVQSVLDRDNVSAADLMAHLVAEGIAKDNQSLADLAQRKLVDIAARWDSIVAAIRTNDGDAS